MATVALLAHDSTLERYMAEVNSHPLLSREEEYRLACRYRDLGDVRAAHQLVVGNLRFVVKIAYEYRGYGFKILDLIQEGNIGLMLAVKKFDPAKGYRLISYAVWWIRAQIQSFVLKSWSLVRLGAGRLKRRLFFNLRALQRLERTGQVGAAAAATQALAAALDVPEAQLLEMEMRLAARDFSLDTQAQEDGKVSHLDLLPSGAASQEEALAAVQESARLRDQMAHIVELLSDKERYILERRLLTEEPVTLQEIGDHFQVSRERIRQLESRLLLKLKGLLTEAQPQRADGSTSKAKGKSH